MFCPFCKAEYRAGITQCSDCSFPLADEIPKDDSDPNFMVLLWNGEGLTFLEVVCAELDRAQIPVATPRLDVLLRDPADRYHLKSLRTFPYVLGVFKRDFEAARRVLEFVAEESSPTISLPPVGAYPDPFDKRAAVVPGSKSGVSLNATTTVYSSEDLQAVEFVQASLDVVNIPFRRVSLESGAYTIQVPPSDENAGRQVVQEIARGISSQAAAAAKEDALLRDEPPTSYFLAWFLPIVYWVFFLMIGLIGNGTSPQAGAMFATLLTIIEAVSVVGSFWLVYQALRYEVKPFRYCLMALVPLTCIWYYIERYRVRKGEERLPVAERIRTRLPPAS